MRPATIADIDSMHRLRLAVRENQLSTPAKVQAHHYVSMLEKEGRGWVYEIDGEIVGFGIADKASRNIWALFIAPGFERQGIGRLLHDTLVNWLFEVGSQPIWLTTAPNTRAEAFYTAAGWERKGIEPSGEIRFEMRKR